MEKEQARQRAIVLRKEINENRYRYHVLDKPRVSDAVDDSLKHELSRIEERYPDLITVDSPTQRIGGEPLDKFEKVKHEIRMLSLNDVFSEDELVKWEERLERLVGKEKIKSSGYYCELKMDGLAVSLIYKNGLFVKGSTRGDGQVGEDVTQNLKTVESIPLKLDTLGEAEYEKEIEVRGEIYLPKKEFERLNRQQASSGEKVYANPRNIAAGSIRQLDPRIAASRNLQFMMYAIATDLNLNKHSDEHKLAKKLGFKTNDANRICKNLGEVALFLKKWSGERDDLPYQTDGVVIGVDDKKVFKQLGVVGKAPRGQIAFKFAAEEATSVIKDIVLQVGRTGKITPVAVMEPTVVAGSTVSRATLHNQDEISRKDIRIGDTVIIHKAGDVIPEVKEVIKRMRNGKEKIFAMPKVCPICGGRLIKKTGQVDWYCTSRNCATRKRREIEHFVSKGAFEIEGLGPKIIQKLIDVGLIENQSDIFRIKKEDLRSLERFADRSADNIVKAIDQKKEISLENFIYALGIRHVGQQMAVDFAKQFGGIDSFIKIADRGVGRMYGVGKEVGDSVVEYLSNPKNLKMIDDLRSLGVVIKNYHSPISTNRLNGKNFVVTGTLETMTRDEAHKKIVQYGGNTQSAISPKTDYLLAGENPGGKIGKAKNLGITVLSEKEFLKMIVN